MCHARFVSHDSVVEREVDLLVKELERYSISIAGVQETKCLGSDIWPIGDWTLLYSGHVLPVNGAFIKIQNVLNRIPCDDLLLLLGDCNAHVGIKDRALGLWSSVLGYFGIEHCNQAGEDLLNFCDLNQMSIMNAWFQKRSHYFGTWTSQRRFCLDVQVMRGATCWIDQKLVRVKLRLDLCCSHHMATRRPAVWKFADTVLHEYFA